MHINRYFFVWLAVCLCTQATMSQLNRIPYNNQQLFLNGANLAWASNASFAADVGRGNTDTTRFADVMLSMHDHGGNALRWWLHTDGTVTPEFDGSGHVIGPGTGTIADIKKVLDIAWERELGIDLCLWSFDMLQSTLSSTALSRNMLLLTDTNYTRAYINNCLIPMVNSLKGHPAIVCWEIFNEPEGMSNEFGWTTQKVPMSSIQRFVNLCAGAIHRTDPSANVTSGAWSFYALSDNALAKTSTQLSKLSNAEKLQIATFFQQKYRTSLTPDEIIRHLEKIESTPYQKNYYSDSRLIAAGYDSAGTLDFYSVHYYSTSTPISTSPFHHPANSWGLNKPIVVAEFAMQAGKGVPLGIPNTSLYETLYQQGYAGALAWSFTDIQISSVASMLGGMQSMWDNHRTDVDLLGTGGDWPYVSITYPQDGATFPDSNQVTIQVTVTDSSAITSVDIFVSDTIKLVELTTAPYTYTWTNIADGVYNLTAAATNSLGHTRTSDIVKITVGKPPMVKLEAETATRKGSGMTVSSDNTASGSKYVNIQAADTNSTMTWTLTSVPAAGNYPITFGYKLSYGSPKSQYININGVRTDTVAFTGSITTKWYEKTLYVDLVKDTNTIQMQMYWAWMYLDYIAVPTSIVPTAVDNKTGSTPASFVLEQNYPNPFNPTTTINFSVPKATNVKLTIFNLLGQKVTTLADKHMEAGVYNFKFDAAQFASGVYFYRLEAGEYLSQKKMLLLK
jgi:hypothetical protein